MSWSLQCVFLIGSKCLTSMDSLIQVTLHKIKKSGSQHYVQGGFTSRCNNKSLKYGLDSAGMQKITQHTGCIKLAEDCTSLCGNGHTNQKLRPALSNIMDLHQILKKEQFFWLQDVKHSNKKDRTFCHVIV